ncbi:hypothetical protein [Ralstonia solanacearum]|uniref:Uncharacterized protein n=1 Tax=Ralstonia solanacearum TaxID=305 RepID=A0AAE3NGJ2_RALSL|nr:hypothetical protein [Ralstonia solanacearum]MBB6583502.1 hypothetical protein [Ralstonia solanacearum]MDB0520579.1 hypothetical protein [Ralstonia solanacearum]
MIESADTWLTSNIEVPLALRHRIAPAVPKTELPCSGSHSNGSSFFWQTKTLQETVESEKRCRKPTQLLSLMKLSHSPGQQCRADDLHIESAMHPMARKASRAWSPRPDALMGRQQVMEACARVG